MTNLPSEAAPARPAPDAGPPPLDPPAPRSPRAAALLAAALFCVLFATYQLDGGFVPSNGAKSNSWLPVQVLQRGSLSFSPDEVPFMFTWRLETPAGPRRARFASFSERAGGRSFAELAAEGRLTVLAPRYYLVPSVQSGRYVDTFGPGAGLTALPLFAVLRAAAGDLAARPRLLWYGAKWAASAAVAGSAALLFLAALALTDRRRALLVALVYGLGSAVWSISSQALYQHGPNELFLGLGLCLLLHLRGRPAYALGAALAFGAAALCRPTSALVGAAVGLHLLRGERRALLGYAAGGLVAAALYGAYQLHYLGSPFTNGQAIAALAIAKEKTGSPSPWQTPPWLGAAGLLVSPSRGLFVFSPVFLFSIYGAARALREARYRALRPVVLGALLLFAIAACWFDWWGGWTYGYRPLVDLLPMLALLLVPALDALGPRPRLRALFLALLGWSILVQALGAFTYDQTGWNARVIDGQARDIDRPEHRGRLWSLRDSQIIYYLGHLAEARRARAEAQRDFIAYPAD